MTDIHPHSIIGQHLAETAEEVAKQLSPHATVVEIVTYDPDDYDTYPSVCQTKQDVQRRFGFVGGERLVFTARGAYIGRLTDELEELEA